eukprot:scaffold15222_cov173-Skeletonema_marinoi.AAC.1
MTASREYLFENEGCPEAWRTQLLPAAAACCCLSSLNPSVGDQNATKMPQATSHKARWMDEAEATRSLAMHQLNHNSTIMSSSSSSSDKDSNDLTDPRFLDLVGRRFGVASDADGGGERDAAYSSNEGTYYQLLSERSKLRLDTLRQLAIERLLVNYSL